jgi:hypothetical protein
MSRPHEAAEKASASHERVGGEYSWACAARPGQPENPESGQVGLACWARPRPGIWSPNVKSGQACSFHDLDKDRASLKKKIRIGLDLSSRAELLLVRTGTLLDF